MDAPDDPALPCWYGQALAFFTIGAAQTKYVLLRWFEKVTRDGMHDTIPLRYMMLADTSQGGCARSIHYDVQSISYALDHLETALPPNMVDNFDTNGSGTRLQSPCFFDMQFV